MPNPDLDLIEQLKDQLYAVQQLLLAHCVALAHLDGDASSAALAIAGGQADALLSQGRPFAGHRLTLLIQEVEQCAG